MNGPKSNELVSILVELKYKYSKEEGNGERDREDELTENYLVRESQRLFVVDLIELLEKNEVPYRIIKRYTQGYNAVSLQLQYRGIKYLYRSNVVSKIFFSKMPSDDSVQIASNDHLNFPYIFD
jgi:hypothetical protein